MHHYLKGRSRKFAQPPSTSTLQRLSCVGAVEWYGRYRKHHGSGTKCGETLKELSEKPAPSTCNRDASDDSPGLEVKGMRLGQSHLSFCSKPDGLLRPLKKADGVVVIGSSSI
jgi:hypothetical protein